MGIIAKVCTYLAGIQVNILDISQTIVDGYFNMMMIVDAGNVEDVTKMSGGLAALGEEIGGRTELSARRRTGAGGDR